MREPYSRDLKRLLDLELVRNGRVRAIIAAYQELAEGEKATPMRSIRPLIFSAIVALTISLAIAMPGAHGDGTQNPPTPTEKAEQNYPNLPNLGSHLSQLVAKVEEGEFSAEEAAADSPIRAGGSLVVTIYLSGNVDGVVSFLEDNGGSPRNVGEDYIEASVPVLLLGPVSEQPGVVRVREIIPFEPAYGDVTSQGVEAHGSSAWNNSGYSGQGVKVGVIDAGFEGFRGLMGRELPDSVVVRCYFDIGLFTQNLDDCENGEAHGTAVSEAIIDIAPDVSFYIANLSSSGDLRETVDWMVSEGISVVNFSISADFDGPGDGTSPYSNSRTIVDNAWTTGSGDLSYQISGLTSGTRYDVQARAGAASGDGLWSATAAVTPATWGAIRSFSTPYVSPGGQVVVTITANGFGAFGEVVETLPPGFSLVASSLPGGAVTGDDQEVKFILIGDTSLTYTVTAPSAAGSYSFSGVLTNSDGEKAPVGGALSITVGSLPSVNISRATGSENATVRPGSPISLTAAFSRPVSGFTVDDITVGNGTVGNFAGSGAVYTFDVTPNDIGEVTVDIAAGAAEDTDGNGNTASPQFSLGITYDDNGDGAISKAEAIAAIRDYFSGGITKTQAIAVIVLYFSSPTEPGPGTGTPEGDRAALIALYNATGGPNWLINNNWLSDVPISEWSGVTTDDNGRVTGLSLTDNGLTGEIPPELGRLSNLTELVLYGNQLTGEIPPELGGLSNLTLLHLGLNQLTGEIPPELGGLSNLTVLGLHLNQLTGEIPPELGRLSNLTGLWLYGNQLTGEIPPELGGLSNLTYLALDGNGLTGEIPPELGGLSNLTRLWLHGNQLTGEIPPELGGLSNLTRLALWRQRVDGRDTA